MSKDYLHQKWKTPAQIEAEQAAQLEAEKLMREEIESIQREAAELERLSQRHRDIPGKTREELDREYEKLREQVAKDMETWTRTPHQTSFGPTRTECVIFGLAAGVILMILLNGGCRVSAHIKSTPNDPQGHTTTK